MERFLTDLRRLNHLVAIAVGVLLVACATFVLLDIVLRQVGASFGGTDEISGYAMAIATSWGMAFTMLELGHVRIDLLRSRLAGRGRVFARPLLDAGHDARDHADRGAMLAGSRELSGQQLHRQHPARDAATLGAGTMVRRLGLVLRNGVADPRRGGRPGRRADASTLRKARSVPSPSRR